MSLRYCPICDNDLPVEAFGIVNARKDGLNRYCKACIRLKVENSRKQFKAYKTRKPEPPKEVFKLNPQEKVLKAISEGKRTQKEILKQTKIAPDELCDILADLLLLSNILETQIVEGQRIYFQKAEKKQEKVYPRGRSIFQEALSFGPVIKGERRVA